MIWFRQDWLLRAAAFMAGLVVLTTTHFTLRSATGVPCWDMFDGTLWFETQFSQGNWGALWQQHNEHRIVFSKLLFLLDLHLANGTTPFLHLVNLFLASAMTVSLLLFSRAIVGGSRINLVNLLILALCFSILQMENFANAFQSQFFLAYLLPLLSLYFAHLSVNDGDLRWDRFAIAVALASSASLTMANGVFALPVLLVYAILMKMNIRRVLLLKVLSILVIVLYFYGFHRVENHTSPLDAILDPIGLFLFISAYMGHSSALGIVVLLFIGFAFVYYLPKRRLHSAEVALLGFVGYVLFSATITALGRLSLGMGAANASRYATPVLAVISSLLILYHPLVIDNNSTRFWRKQSFWRCIGFSLMIVVLLGQARTFRWTPERNFSHLLGALALELGIADQDTVGKIYSDVARAFNLSARARAVPQMIWDMEPIKNSRFLIGNKIDAAPPITCRFSIEEVTRKVSNSSMQRWDGWIDVAAHQMIYLTTQSGRVLGVGLIGRYREDVRDQNSDLGNYVGFGLYAVDPLPKEQLFLGSASQRCRLSERDFLK